MDRAERIKSKRRIRETALTFSPGEWVWVGLAVLAFGGLIALGS